MSVGRVGQREIGKQASHAAKSFKHPVRSRKVMLFNQDSFCLPCFRLLSISPVITDRAYLSGAFANPVELSGRFIFSPLLIIGAATSGTQGPGPYFRTSSKTHTLTMIR